MSHAVAGQVLALDGASVITAVGGVAVAVIAAGVALWQTRRTRVLEKEKIRLQFDADLRLREQEWAHERSLSERERRRASQQADQELARTAEQLAARRSSLVAEAAAYCERLARELATLRILDMSRPLRLDRLYVQVRVQEQQPLRFVREEELAARDGGRDATHRQTPVPDSGPNSHTYAPVDALQRYQRMVVVGDPGAGKTTMLRHLALRMARQSEGESLPELPAYVELFRFVESGHESLLDYLAEHWADQYGFADAREYVAERLTDGTAALLLDGLDEVLGGESAEDAASAYNRVTEEIARLATRFPRALIATTCRRHGWQGGLPQFQVLEALDFEWPQIETFVANWFGDRDRRRGGLVRALAGNARLQTLAANPLLLSLIAIVYERDLELPERRAALYRRCVEVLLREWDAHRKIARYSRFTTDRKQDLLKQLAWHYHQRGQRYFPEDDLLDLIADFLPTIDLPREDARAILDEIAAQYGLLKAQAHGWYGFLHLTLQEHFAAMALLERGEEGIRWVVGCRYDPWWEEVILLLAGALPDATPLLSGVLQLPPGDGDLDLLELPTDDLFHTDLLLAARCLTGVPRVADVGLRRRIVRGVWALLETSEFDGERQRAAEAIVGVVGSEEQLTEVIGYIGDEHKGIEARAALVDALAAHGGRNVGERLMGVLAFRSALPELLRDHLISAVGLLRVESAVLILEAELTETLDRLQSRTDNSHFPFSLLSRIHGVLRALGTIGAPAGVFVRTIDAYGESDLFVDIVGGIENWSPDARDAGVQEWLLELLLRPNDWFFERWKLAAVYLNMAGDPGAGVLLEAVRSGLTIDHQKIPLMAALAEYTAKGHGSAYRDSLLALARDEELIWSVRWLALECLDHIPGDTEELRPIVEGRDVRVSVAAATTSAAWGTPLGLDIVRGAVLDGTMPHDLRYDMEPDRSHGWPGMIAHRVAEVLSPYGDLAVAQHLSDADVTSRRAVDHALGWLYALAPEAGVDLYLRLSRQEVLDIRAPSPTQVPYSRVHAVLEYTHGASASSEYDLRSLLSAAAAVADDAESVGLLLRHVRQPDHEIGGHAYDLAHTVSRRARVRVLRDHTIEPLP
ncbi:NACHT domain-containing protein [Streptomyces sp. NPDC088196]|uniref:NACHT domain-containing protein n=1 Tax=Streptomyces sp. NPDC088196 TaxID=3154868 RepID=UPI00344E7787